MLLPCNVVVRTDPAADGTVIVDALHPQATVQVADQPSARRSRRGGGHVAQGNRIADPHERG
ncbi:hypothetical protein [Mycolicibacterium chlorophenolicum]|uniref:hypothetical protein n=1 Tax=Mycolicibacterium chlorophenolicum TaxID=37916 RepID=UPI003993B3B0